MLPINEDELIKILKKSSFEVVYNDYDLIPYRQQDYIVVVENKRTGKIHQYGYTEEEKELVNSHGWEIAEFVECVAIRDKW